MNPDRHASSHYDYFKNLIKGDDASTEAHRNFYDEYNAVLDMDADYYLETIKTVFQEFDLVNGTWQVRTPRRLEPVRPQDIHSVGLLTVEGELDDISGSGQTQAAQDLCTGIPAKDRRHFEVAGAGHYGIFSGRRWREQVYPVVRDFIAAHDKPQTRADHSILAAEDAVPAPAPRKRSTAVATRTATAAVAAKTAAPARKTAPRARKSA